MSFESHTSFIRYDATILTVYTDDPEAPYYLISLVNGNELQTTGEYLSGKSLKIGSKVFYYKKTNAKLSVASHISNKRKFTDDTYLSDKHSPKPITGPITRSISKAMATSDLSNKRFKKEHNPFTVSNINKPVPPFGFGSNFNKAGMDNRSLRLRQPVPSFGFGQPVPDNTSFGFSKLVPNNTSFGFGQTVPSFRFGQPVPDNAPFNFGQPVPDNKPFGIANNFNNFMLGKTSFGFGFGRGTMKKM